MRWVRGQDRDEVIEIDVNVLVELHRQGALVIAVFEAQSRHAFGTFAVPSIRPPTTGKG